MGCEKKKGSSGLEKKYFGISTWPFFSFCRSPNCLRSSPDLVAVSVTARFQSHIPSTGQTRRIIETGIQAFTTWFVLPRPKGILV